MTSQRSGEHLRHVAAGAAESLAHASPQEIIAWAVRIFGSRVVVASSMADTHLVHLAQAVSPGIDVLFLDTGYHFAETIGTRDAVEQTHDITLHSITPRQTVAEQDSAYGPKLHDRDPDLCCALRKVEPLERGLAPYEAWITGMRREDAPTRAALAPVAYDERRAMVKLSPLAAWTQDDADAYITDNNVLVNPLYFDGYASIGCEPCTRRVEPGRDQRSGRWSGLGKTECGIHT
ncbi:MAG TPA: phosphoadenylyl-sulfate reductase [Actinocrinis sp.]|nr:phosphoadenylyl-sulfate reductase [Actinocrinis sp.]